MGLVETGRCDYSYREEKGGYDTNLEYDDLVSIVVVTVGSGGRIVVMHQAESSPKWEGPSCRKEAKEQRFQYRVSSMVIYPQR